MPEKEPNFLIEQLRSELMLARMKASRLIDRAVGNASYTLATTPQERKTGLRMSEFFGQEMMEFFDDNPTEKLAPLHPTKAQVDVAHLLLDSARSGELTRKSFFGMRGAEGEPYIVKKYSVGEEPKSTTVSLTGLEEFEARRVGFITVRWGVREPFGHGIAMYGEIGWNFTRSLDFMTFPEKIQNEQQVREHLNINPKHDMKTKVRVLDKGSRINFSYEAQYRGATIYVDHQYYFVGMFDGTNTKREHWVYGNNANANKRSVTEPVAQGSLVTGLAK
jgi:hypothetical protein